MVGGYEKILGDSAICVHPKDDRYKHLVGKFAFVPLINRRIPIIADDYVEIEFGTGALKVTPAHDMNDFVLGQKYNLEVIDTINDDGTLSQAAGFRSPATIEMASAGQATAHKPQAVHLSAPCSSLFKMWCPR